MATIEMRKRERENKTNRRNSPTIYIYTFSGKAVKIVTMLDNLHGPCLVCVCMFVVVCVCVCRSRSRSNISNAFALHQRQQKQQQYKLQQRLELINYIFEITNKKQESESTQR